MVQEHFVGQLAILLKVGCRKRRRKLKILLAFDKRMNRDSKDANALFQTKRKGYH